MRTALITLSLMFLGLTAGAQEHDALLMVHFGTTHDATRAKTIDAINDKVSRALPQLRRSPHSHSIVPGGLDVMS